MYKCTTRWWTGPTHGVNSSKAALFRKYTGHNIEEYKEVDNKQDTLSIYGALHAYMNIMMTPILV